MSDRSLISGGNLCFRRFKCGALGLPPVFEFIAGKAFLNAFQVKKVGEFGPLMKISGLPSGKGNELKWC